MPQEGKREKEKVPRFLVDANQKDRYRWLSTDRAILREENQDIRLVLSNGWMDARPVVVGVYVYIRDNN